MSEYGGWSEVTGAIAWAPANSSTLKFETPIHRTLPSRCSAAEGRPAFLGFLEIIRGPVDLIEIDHLRPQTPQAGFHFAAN